jgi:hypothetical protein
LVKKSRDFLSYIPAALDSLGSVLQEIDGLEPLRGLLAQLHR